MSAWVWLWTSKSSAMPALVQGLEEAESSFGRGDPRSAAAALRAPTNHASRPSGQAPARASPPTQQQPCTAPPVAPPPPASASASAVAALQPRLVAVAVAAVSAVAAPPVVAVLAATAAAAAAVAYVAVDFVVVAAAAAEAAAVVSQAKHRGTCRHWLPRMPSLPEPHAAAVPAQTPSSVLQWHSSSSSYLVRGLLGAKDAGMHPT
mmetsp:Transcript_10199/g.25221  ORF Transcript_10199/g.25221 Transcript_10199/m.25221 type:complete len:206 (+) Transcript_10199:595-1212(+)